MGKLKGYILLFTAVLFGFLALALSGPSGNPFAADPCDVDACNLPDCRCSSQIPPEGITGPNMPQMVFVTFDDAITIVNHPFYQEVLFDRKNPNDAPIAATFFITHEYTNYSLVHDLWVRGHDIALHSITHLSDTQYWANLDETGWRAEIVNQRAQLSAFSGVSLEHIKGMRAPFLQVGGNPMYSALTGGSFEWECSRPTQNQRIPGLWPYTNDYLSTQDCQIPTCPDEAFPGFWTFPMIDLIGDDQFPCAMVDECTPIPMTQAATYGLLKRNFDDQYLGTRAPFGVFLHAAWLIGPDDRPEFGERKRGFIQFLDELDALDDVYLVGISQAMDWMKTPQDMSQINDFEPWKEKAITRGCQFPRNCRYANDTWERFMSSCIPCPPNYPWLHNPQGTGVSLTFD